LASYPDVDFVFCAGDDRTDEDMFKALRRSEMLSDNYFCTTIGASSKKTLAGWHVGSPEDIIRALHTMADAGRMN
jgi:trehalose 6-phosphate synthase/phosphatase